ncbi:MAG TPA: Holliday junction branch migration protein RuvA [Candidatus Paceibacterota bacterium]
MISYLSGTVEHIGERQVILNTGAIGYAVIVLPKVRNSLSKKQGKVNQDLKPQLTLFIHSQMNMREGTFDLYGFDSKEDLDLFRLLTSVNGIGPKMGMAIMSSVEPKHLKAAIVNDDSDYLKKVSGLGPKTAQRLILELKNKVDHIEGDSGVNLGQEGQAMDALLVLGYSPSQAKEALRDTLGETVEEKVREALKGLGRK